jgi:CheY-like chemotaxis protein
MRPARSYVYTQGRGLPSPAEDAVDSAKIIPFGMRSLRQTTQQEGHAAKDSILLVEDNPLLRNVIRRTLMRLGWRVRAAEHGQDALEQLAQSVPDVILTDIEMPEMDGIELRQKASTNHRELPIVFMSGNPDALASTLSTLLLSKPFTAQELSQVLTRACTLSYPGPSRLNG